MPSLADSGAPATGRGRLGSQSPKLTAEEIFFPSGNAAGSQLADFVDFCSKRADRRFTGPSAFHDFSVGELRRFWSLFLEWSGPLREGDSEPVCTEDLCETAVFFPNLRLNYAENLLRASPAQAERVEQVAGSLPTLKALVALDSGTPPGGIDVPVLPFSDLFASAPAHRAGRGDRVAGGSRRGAEHRSSLGKAPAL